MNNKHKGSSRRTAAGLLPMPMLAVSGVAQAAQTASAEDLLKSETRPFWDVLKSLSA